MAPQCKQCRETAATACKQGFCGKCCWPRCDPYAHNRRREPRGTEGAPRRARTGEIWHRALELADVYIEHHRMTFVAMQRNLTRGQVQHIISGALRQLAQDPSLDPNDASISDVLTSTISPGDLERLVSRLRSLGEERDVPRGAASSEPADN